MSWHAPTEAALLMIEDQLMDPRVFLDHPSDPLRREMMPHRHWYSGGRSYLCQYPGRPFTGNITLDPACQWCRIGFVAHCVNNPDGGANVEMPDGRMENHSNIQLAISLVQKYDDDIVRIAMNKLGWKIPEKGQ